MRTHTLTRPDQGAFRLYAGHNEYISEETVYIKTYTLTRPNQGAFGWLYAGHNEYISEETAYIKTYTLTRPDQGAVDWLYAGHWQAASTLSEAALRLRHRQPASTCRHMRAVSACGHPPLSAATHCASLVQLCHGSHSPERPPVRPRQADELCLKNSNL